MPLNQKSTYLVGITGGIIGPCIYLAGVFIALIFVPQPYSPLTNMISTLGNQDYNSVGAIWFNVGNIVMGLALVPFFFGFRVWYTEDKNQILLVKITQIAGYFIAFSVVMIGIFPENLGVIHGFWGQFFFCSNLGVMILSFISFRTHPKFPKVIGVYCLAVAIFNVGYAFAFISEPIIEWLAVFPALGLVVLMVANMVRTFRKTVETGTSPSPPA